MKTNETKIKYYSIYYYSKRDNIYYLQDTYSTFAEAKRMFNLDFEGYIKNSQGKKLKIYK